MLKAIKLRIYPEKEQIIYISKLLGSSRFIYNNCLAFKIKEYKENAKSIRFSELGKHLTHLKSEFIWLKDSHSKVLQQSLINLDKAYKGFFKGGGFPKFKSRKENKQSCRFPVDAIIGINGNRISLIKQLKDIHFKCSVKDEKYLNKHQELVKSITLTKTKSGKYYLSVLIDKPNKIVKPNSNIVGIDLGIKDFIVCSDGTKYENIKIKRNNKDRLAKLQRIHSKRVKGSKNKEKARIKLAKYSEKLNNIKEYYLHQVVNTLLNENQVIVMEDLNVSGMMKNRKLARSIQELSLYRFKQILKYKADWQDKFIIEIDQWFPSSKLCNICGFKNKDITLKDREWDCPNCRTNHDRDKNAADNIENEGIRIILNDPILIKKIGLSSPELLERVNAFGDNVRPEHRQLSLN